MYFGKSSHDLNANMYVHIRVMQTRGIVKGSNPVTLLSIGANCPMDPREKSAITAAWVKTIFYRRSSHVLTVVESGYCCKFVRWTLGPVRT